MPQCKWSIAITTQSFPSERCICINCKQLFATFIWDNAQMRSNRKCSRNYLCSLSFRNLVCIKHAGYGIYKIYAIFFQPNWFTTWIWVCGAHLVRCIRWYTIIAMNVESKFFTTWFCLDYCFRERIKLSTLLRSSNMECWPIHLRGKKKFLFHFLHVEIFLRHHN